MHFWNFTMQKLNRKAIAFLLVLKQKKMPKHLKTLFQNRYKATAKSG